MSQDKNSPGTVCKDCGKVWNDQGKGLFQTWDIRAAIDAGYKPVVCERCRERRAVPAKNLPGD